MTRRRSKLRKTVVGVLLAVYAAACVVWFLAGAVSSVAEVLGGGGEADGQRVEPSKGQNVNTSKRQHVETSKWGKAVGLWAWG